MRPRREDHPVEARFRFSAVRQKPPLGIALGLRACGHVENFEFLENIEIRGVIDDQLMTRLMDILVPHVLFVPWVAGGFSLRFSAILRSLLASGGPPLPFFALAASLLDAGLLHGLEIKDLAVGGGQGLGDASIPAERALGQLFGGQMA